MTSLFSNQTHSVVRYNSEFQQLCLQINDISEAEKLDKYIRGLKSAIREKVELDEPRTLADAMSKAQRIDSITYHSRMMHGTEQTSANTYRTSTADSILWSWVWYMVMKMWIRIVKH